MRTETNLSSIRQDGATEHIECISAGRGDLIFIGNLRINGVFSGKVNVSGFLTLSSNARVTGEVTAQDMIVEGHLVGTVKILNRVCFQSGSFFSGSITASEAEISKACTISGQSYFSRIIEKEAIPGGNKGKGFLVSDTSIPDDIIFPSFQF
jgi:cytoskeletal protein CcmA (bactofilin family)